VGPGQRPARVVDANEPLAPGAARRHVQFAGTCLLHDHRHADASRGLSRAIRRLRDHFAEPLRIETLAKHVGMSPSALHLRFKSVTALSPLQYRKRLRLQEARRLMLGEGRDAGGAGFRVGYESPSQFGREYRRMFGAPPRQDVTALKHEAQLT
jgi:AraC-like DNA-binding protein